MEITMLYFDTIARLINKYGYTWQDVRNIQDHDGRVKRAYRSCTDDCKMVNYAQSLRRDFRETHMCREFDEDGEYEQPLIAAFLEALEEARNQM